MHKSKYNQIVFKGFLYQPHIICSEKYIKEETQFLIDMFENEHKRTFLGNLAKYCHAKKKNNDSRNYTNPKSKCQKRKSCGR